jgi:hypothetical protein
MDEQDHIAVRFLRTSVHSLFLSTLKDQTEDGQIAKHLLELVKMRWSLPENNKLRQNLPDLNEHQHSNPIKIFPGKELLQFCLQHNIQNKSWKQKPKISWKQNPTYCAEERRRRAWNSPYRRKTQVANGMDDWLPSYSHAHKRSSENNVSTPRVSPVA